MNILFTICGRAGSKGIKNKNIRMFLDKPLPAYTIAAIDLYLKNHEDISYDIAVNSDSDELIELMRNNRTRDIEVIKRDSSLGGDSVGKILVIKNCLEIMMDRKKCHYDVVVDLDITSPLRRVIDVENLIDKHISSGADVTTSVTTARRNPYFNQVKKTEKGYKKVIESQFTARQQAPEILDMNASLYAYNPEFLMQGKGIFEGYVETIMMYDTGILDLDHENDMILMEIIAKHLFSSNNEFFEVYKNTNTSQYEEDRL